MLRLIRFGVTAAVALMLLTMSGTSTFAVPFSTGFTSGGNWNHLYAQGFSPAVRANPDPFVDPGLNVDDLVPLDRFRFFKSGYTYAPDPEQPDVMVPLVAENFQLAIVSNYFVNLSTLTTSSPELVGLSTNTIATTATYATNDPIDFAFNSLELSYGAIDYAAIFVRNDGAGNLAIVDVPVNIVNYVETPPGSGTYLPDTNYGDPSADYVYSASNYRTGNYLTTFNPPFADASFVAFFDLPDTLLGDFNGDQKVDAADYTVWRDGLGGAYGPDDYNTWKNNFGATLAGAGAVTASAAVPEPAAFVLLLTAAAFLCAAGRCGGRQ